MASPTSASPSSLAYFKPAHDLTPALIALYAANRVTVTRQFPYDPNSHKTIDLALLVNGIPTATVELKNPLTNQNVEHAIEQYRNDRDPSNVTLARRALVHFAVDPDRVAMTTKLAGTTPDSSPSTSATTGERGTRRTSPATAPPTCGNGSGSGTPGWTSSPDSSTSRYPPRVPQPPLERPRWSSSPVTTSGTPS